MAHLVWFRSDLRVSDNTALVEATQGTTPTDVYGVFFVSLEQWRGHDWGDPKIAFLLRCVSSLQKNLHELGIPLYLVSAPRFSDIPDRLLSLARHLGAHTIFANKEYELNEQKRDSAVAEQVENHDLVFRLFHDQTCVPPDEPALSTASGGPYTVFSPFRKKFIDVFYARGGISLKKPPKQVPFVSPPDFPESFVSIDEIPVDISLFAEHWPGGERDGLARLRQFSESGLSEYSEQRDFPWRRSGTSGLSAYLAVGAISPRTCLAAAMRANDGKLSLEKNGAMTWASELIWREFYRHVLVHHPRICRYHAFKEKVDRDVEWRYDEHDFQAWCEGRTGYPLVDAAMRQLLTTGWMHNRLRMVVAMFLTKHLLIDWRWGERFFNQHLIDADFASNNGGWQWSSSTGTDAQPYFRIFNPYSQSEKFDAKGDFIREYCPELSVLTGKDVHHPSPAQCAQLGYPLPIVDHREGRERALDAFKR